MGDKLFSIPGLYDYDPGYAAPETTGENVEDAFWDTGKFPCGDSPSLLPLVAWPDFLSLTVTLSPQPVMSDTVIQTHRGALTFAPTPLYDPTVNPGGEGESQELCGSGPCRSIEVVYEEEGWSRSRGPQGGPLSPPTPFQGREGGIFRLMLGEEKVIYRQVYRVQEKKLVSQHIEEEPEGKGWSLTPPGEKNARGLYAYGGLYKPGLSLDQMTQLYFYMTDFQERTQGVVRPLSYWRERGISPPQGGTWEGIKFLFMEEQTLPLPPPSLEEALEKGYAQVILQVADPKESQYLSLSQSQRLYHSVECRPLSAGENSFTLVFQPHPSGE